MPFDPKVLIEDIKEQYLELDNNRPWILGFSGGKDSTMMLQLVWYALKSIPKELRQRQVYVVCNNTLVENPLILEYTHDILLKIEKAAKEQSMPMFVQRTTPKLEDTFWVNLIGKGYPSPNKIFRWCTERLKIAPTTKFILEKISEEGEVIILLGTRSNESSRRARSIKEREISGQRLRKHVLPNAYVYAPIKDVMTDDLWQYLLAAPSPWNGSNRQLVTLYRNANGGDCPLVIDDTSPSCGNSRFGCWVCTVVNKDKSMEALIDNGEEWMMPLSALRDLLAVSRDSEEYRELRRRNGQLKEGMLGPYKPFFRAELLQKLLLAQKEIQVMQPDIDLINFQELVAIQVLWYRDNIFNQNVSDIYNQVYGVRINLDDYNEKYLKEKKLLKESCSSDKDFDLINNLLALQKSKTILMNNRGLQNDLENKIEHFLKEKPNVHK
ncbi:MAG: DNA phosphorothioation system sulfurtransferase DndC [Proteobacteria bacterium]|nr:MAG: DNA phosphorothioation system sulfurtransferase DndC [Pseudomonadota bacterium]